MDNLYRREYIFQDQPNNGWVSWKGEQKMLTPGIDIDVKLRSGRLIYFRSPDCIGGNWIHDGSGRDIVAYRIYPKAAELEGLDNSEVPF
ncbi:hypothetical protein EMM73_15215 [Rheinheimera sediminis]|uniref:hypothetical protein n=1 Tax=Rheinheimera sp. YQF-1 TaxID=2499626 RepID=UPI000FD84869|nr:hypothetical protein [Rheinheimera sp. YQF-1]RVT44839.1 hypothetical protein EMM73_15215 [Rheinheimera sp. YQF-1]